MGSISSAMSGMFGGGSRSATPERQPPVAAAGGGGAAATRSELGAIPERGETTTRGGERSGQPQAQAPPPSQSQSQSQSSQAQPQPQPAGRGGDPRGAPLRPDGPGLVPASTAEPKTDSRRRGDDADDEKKGGGGGSSSSSRGGGGGGGGSGDSGGVSVSLTDRVEVFVSRIVCNDLKDVEQGMIGGYVP